MSLEPEITVEPATLMGKIDSRIPPDEDDDDRLVLCWPDANKKGKPFPSFKNLLYFMGLFDIAIHDDAFKWEYVLKGVPNRTRLDDKAILDFMLVLDACGLKMDKGRLWDLLMAIAQLNTVHELRDEFDAMEAEWREHIQDKPNGYSVIDTWLHDYAYVDDNAYTRQVGAKPLIAAVRRVRNPGYPFKYMIVLEGPQDIRKSSLLRILGLDKYFDDNLEFGASTKEIMEISSGVVIHEVPELSKMSNRQVETIKAMLSRQKDKARLAYGRTTTEMARQFILIGTSNDRKYLRDITGNVRFWPVLSRATLQKPIDTEGFQKVVRLLWGEAAARERAGVSVYLEGEALRLAQVEQNNRFDGDENYEVLEAALEGKEGFVLNTAVFDICGIEPGAARKRSQITKPIRHAMTKLGWEPDKRTIREVADAFGTMKTKQELGYTKGILPAGILDSWWKSDAHNEGLMSVLNGTEHNHPSGGTPSKRAAARDSGGLPVS